MVRDFKEISIWNLNEHFPHNDLGWSLSYNNYCPEREKLRESLCTLGNGRFAIRGAGITAKANAIHYPATYIVGGFNRVVSNIEGKSIENEDLVNFPNGIYMSFREEGQTEWFDLEKVEILFYEQDLDTREGTLVRRLRVKAPNGHITTILR